MKPLVRFGALLLPVWCFLLCSFAEGTPVVYVNAAASGTGADGSTWAKAYVSLSQAITAANALAPTPANPVQIWVASGTYTPAVTSSADPRSATFAPATGVEIFGGFNGTEGSLAARSPSTPLPILSGDLSYRGSRTALFSAPTSAGTATTFSRPDPSDPGFADNARNVITLNNVTAVLLDSLIISGGYASTPTLTDEQVQAMSFPALALPPSATTVQPISPLVSGGGISVQAAAPNGDYYELTLSNCVVKKVREFNRPLPHV